MLIRPLTPGDAAAYVVIRREMLADSPWSFISSPEHDRGCDVAGMAASLAGPDYAVVGAFAAERYEQSSEADARDNAPFDARSTTHGARLVAVAGVYRERAAKRRHIAWLWGVYTTPAMRGRGLARAVLLEILATARSWPGLAAVYLGVSENAPAARKLYDALGFQPWGAEPDAIRIDDRSFAETHMRLEL
ncbi:MAG: N-acetyltransferase family protein [Phycisphaerae bacterium]